LILFLSGSIVRFIPLVGKHALFKWKLGMARADLILNLVRTGIERDDQLFRKTVEAIAAEEHSKRHYAFAEQPPVSG